MVPFIDVMLVLLIIFMISAPLITTGVVDLPSVGKSSQRPDHVIEVIVGKDETLRLRVDGKGEGAALPLARLKARVLEVQGGNAQTPVVISADKNVKYDEVVSLLGALHAQGVKRVGLVAKEGG